MMWSMPDVRPRSAHDDARMLRAQQGYVSSLMRARARRRRTAETRNGGGPEPRRRRVGVHAGHEHYKWWALSCTSLGMLLATINSGTLIIALPDLERALHTSILSLVWVILAYMIASTVLVLTAGR